MAIAGFGQLVGVAIHGKALDKMGLKKVCYLNLACLFLWISVLMAYNYFYNFSFWFAGIMTFTYGL